MGVLALGVALHAGGKPTDQQGSLLVLAGLPVGSILVAMAVTGLVAYSLWGFIRAVFDPLHRGHDPVGLAERAGFLWSGFTYGALALFGIQLLSGHHDGGPGLAGEAAHFLASPAGRLAAAGAGLIGLAAGAGQLIEVARAGFEDYFQLERMSKSERRAAVLLGRYGMLSRGVVFGLVGWFLLQAAVNGDPGRVHGFGGALAFLQKMPFGSLLLATVALGFVALGLHSLALARWANLKVSRR
jgi:hypothetical protein